MDLNKISTFIRTRRKELGMTQQELALKLFVTEKAVSRWETGRGTPDISLLIPLSKELNVDISEILSGESKKTEVEKIFQERNVNFKFEEIPLTTEFDSLTFNRFFKQVAVLINDNDQLFVDVTFGMKPYSISLFVAVAYAEKAARNVDVDTVIYAQKYSGFSRAKTAEEKAKDPSKSRIYDITGLFYLNAIAGNAKPGQKHKLDKALDLLIND